MRWAADQHGQIGAPLLDIADPNLGDSRGQQDPRDRPADPSLAGDPDRDVPAPGERPGAAIWVAVGE